MLIRETRNFARLLPRSYIVLITHNETLRIAASLGPFPRLLSFEPPIGTPSRINLRFDSPHEFSLSHSRSHRWDPRSLLGGGECGGVHGTATYGLLRAALSSYLPLVRSMSPVFSRIFFVFFLSTVFIDAHRFIIQ